MVSRHFFISSIVTAVIAILFGIFVYNFRFELSEEYQLVPEGFVLPKGCDIRVDMQTGETWAKLRKEVPDINSSIADDDLIFSKDPTNDAPEYKNITKSRIQARLSAEMQANLEAALSNLNEESSWNFLEEEASAMEFGLAILEAKNFNVLREFLAAGNVKALQIISICLQNNPLAVEKFIELEIHLNELKNLIKTEKLNLNVFKKILRILESFKIHGNDEKFNETISEDIKRHSETHLDLEERYMGIIALFK